MALGEGKALTIAGGQKVIQALVIAKVPLAVQEHRLFRSGAVVGQGGFPAGKGNKVRMVGFTAYMKLVGVLVIRGK